MEKYKGMSEIKIALIGYTQSGKTTLAAGLFASSDKQFSVSGRDGDTNKLLSNLCNELASGEWPQATQMKEMPSIELRIDRGRNSPVFLSFQDYMGERLQKDSDEAYRKIIGDDTQGVLILLNPGMDLFMQKGESLWNTEIDKVNIEKKELMLSDIKHIISKIEVNKKNCRHVCLVITASDLLEGHMMNRKESFDSYRKQIEDFLSAHPVFKTKVCEVTIVGKLDDPKRPTNPRTSKNNSREPVEWIISEIEKSNRWRENKRMFVKWIRRVFFVGSAAAALFFGWYFWIDRQCERETRAVFESHATLLDKALHEKKMSEINRICREMEKQLDVIRKRYPFFAANRNRLDEIRKRLLNEIEKGRIKWFPMEFERIHRQVIYISPVDGLSVSDYKNRIEAIAGVVDRLEKFCVVMPSNKTVFVEVENNCRAIASNAMLMVEAGACSGYNRRLKNLSRGFEKKFRSVGELVDAKDAVETWKKFDNDYSDVVLGYKVYQKKFCSLKAEAAAVRTNLFAKIDKHNASVMKRRFDDFVKKSAENASEDACRIWRKTLEDWMPFGMDTGKIKVEMLRQFDDRKSEFRSAYETCRFKTAGEGLVAKLTEICEISDIGDELHALLIECNKYKSCAENEEANPFVVIDCRKEVWDKVRNARAKVLSVLLANQISRIRIDGPEIPAVTVDDRAFLDSILKKDEALSLDEYNAWHKELGEKVNEVKQKWTVVQNKACDEFLKTLAGKGDVYDKVKSYASFYAEHPFAPGLRDLVLKLHDDIGAAVFNILKEVRGYRDGFVGSVDNDEHGKSMEKGMKHTFSDLRMLCNGIVKIKCPLLRRSCWYDFAKTCVEIGKINKGFNEAFPQKYIIERIDVKLEYKEFGWLMDNISSEACCRVFDSDTKKWKNVSLSGKFKSLTKESNNNWITVWSGYDVIKGSSLKDIAFYYSFKENKKTGVLEQTGASGFHFYGGATWMTNNGKYVESEVKLESNNIRYRVYLSSEGVDIFDLIPQNQNLELK